MSQKKNLTNNSSKKKQWLNIIIIVISGLVLVFTLIGKFIGDAENGQQLTISSPISHSPNTSDKNVDVRSDNKPDDTSLDEIIKQKKPLLSAINFHNNLTISKQIESKQTIKLVLETYGWRNNSADTILLTEKQILTIPEQWNKLINQPFTHSELKQSSEPLEENIVKLYFSGNNIPLMVKINVSADQFNQLQTFIIFESTNQIIVKPADYYWSLVPAVGANRDHNNH